MTKPYHVADISGCLDLTRMRSGNIMDELVERTDMANHCRKKQNAKLPLHVRWENADTY